MSECAKVVINDKIQYELFSYGIPPMSMFLDLVLKSVDYDKAKKDFSNVQSISILGFDGLECYRTINYCTVNSISLYNNFSANPVEAIHIELRNTPLTEQIEQLKEAVFSNKTESEMTLEEYKRYRIQESKNILEKYLEENPLVSSCHGGVEGTYSVTKEKQILMSQNLLTYTTEKILRGDDAILTWNETGNICEVWTEEEFTTLLLEVKDYVYPKIALQQKYEAMINECTDKPSVKEIEFDYSIDISLQELLNE